MDCPDTSHKGDALQFVVSLEDKPFKGLKPLKGNYPGGLKF